MPRKIDPPEIRVWRFIEGSVDGCWMWIGAKAGNGYGSFTVRKGDQRTAHRYLYELLIGPVAPNLQLDHLCRVRACVRPSHLEPVTGEENTRRMRTKTHCIRGHPLTPGNVYDYSDHGGSPHVCKQCGLARYHESRQRKMANGS